MYVRRRPTSQSGLLHTHSCSVGRPQAVCVCWHGAVYVLLRDLLQPALGCMGRRPGHQHAGAPPPCVMVTVTGLLRTQLCSGERPQPCACAGAAQYMFSFASVFNQPVKAWDVGQVSTMNVRRRPTSQSGFLHTHSCSEGWPQAVCVCWRGAGHVQQGDLFQPAFGSMGCQPGYCHECAPPPCVSVRAHAHT